MKFRHIKMCTKQCSGDTVCWGKKALPGVAAQAFTPRTHKAEAGGFCEFEIIPVYTASSRAT